MEETFSDIETNDASLLSEDSEVKYEARVVRIQEVLPHPDPETVNLGLVKIWDYIVVVNKYQWTPGSLGIYIEPDTLVPLDNEHFSFLRKGEETHSRITVRKFRKVWSEGLLIPIFSLKRDAGIDIWDFPQEGENMWEYLGLQRWQPKSSCGRFRTTSSAAPRPRTLSLPQRYNIDNFKKNRQMFVEGEDVYISEKIHGSFFAAVFDGIQFHISSKNIWQKMESDNIWAECVKQNPSILHWCEANPKKILTGEVFGHQNLKYGLDPGKLSFLAFDIWDCEKQEYLPYVEFCELLIGKVPMVPMLYIGPFDQDVVKHLTDGQTCVKLQASPVTQIREGCVIKSMDGKRSLKSVSNDYLNLK